MRTVLQHTAFAAFSLGTLDSGIALAQAPNSTGAAASLSGESSDVPRGTNALSSVGPLSLRGYVEAYYQWNANDPSNGITNFRGFDSRHNTFSISNVALDLQWDDARILGRVTFQVGHTASTYYMSEPSVPGAAGANSSSPELWKFVQQAYSGYRFGNGQDLTISAGIFLSPVGPESIAAADNWNWSRSSLFFALPFYHTGAKATYSLTDAWAATIAGYNGWNSVVDNNAAKSLSAQLSYTTPSINTSLLYFGGVERTRNAPEGRAWRHLVDGHVMWQVTEQMSFLGHVNAGLEPNAFGMSGWLGGALYGRVRVLRNAYFAIRGDALYERTAKNANGRAASIFFPAAWVSSGTATIDYRPDARVTFRAEYRRDHAAAPMYFGGAVAGDENATSFVPNRRTQDTVTVGITTSL